jgi:hypothetical protein
MRHPPHRLTAVLLLPYRAGEGRDFAASADGESAVVGEMASVILAAAASSLSRRLAMKSATKKNRPAVSPAVVSAVEPLESRELYSVSPAGVSPVCDNPTEHAVQTVTLQNGALTASTQSLNFTKISYGLFNFAAGA